MREGESEEVGEQKKKRIRKVAIERGREWEMQEETEKMGEIGRDEQKKRM